MRVASYPHGSGSPPQVRGTLHDLDDVKHLARLTPAGAGNISASQPGGPGRWAHPRRCGEHWVAVWLRRTMAGSPPQVRGTSSEA